MTTILKTNNHFLIQVKGNTSKLFEQVKQISQANPLIDSDYTIDQVSGRQDNRIVEVFEARTGQIDKTWPGIQRIIKVYRWDEKASEQTKAKRKSKNRSKQKSTNGVHYYILSKKINQAKFLGRMIRNHWLIENHLHWAKDVYLKEDHMTICGPEVSALIAALNNIALNQIRNAGYKPSKDFFTRITNNVKELFKIVRT